MAHPSQRQSFGKAVFPMTVLAVAALACNTLSGLVPMQDSTETPGPAQSTSAAANPQARCVQEGYPCSYSEADPETIARSVEMMDIADAIMEAGGTVPDAGARLEQEADVVDLNYDRLSLRFRVKGGPPMWLIDPAIMQSDPASAAENHLLARPMGQDDGPVGGQKEGEEPEHRSLVLAPFLWDFATNEGPHVDRIIASSSNYQCKNCRKLVVSYRSKLDADHDGELDDFSTGGVTLEDFQSWNKYDIIHVSTHGMQVCPNELNYTPQDFSPQDPGCYTALLTGISVHKKTFDTIKSSPGFGVGGVAWGHIPGKKECASLKAGSSAYENANCYEAGLWWELVTADFFRIGYPGGLDDKFIFLSACESMKGSDLAAALAGQNATVLGWTESVFGSVAESVATTFYQHYIRDGLTAEKAYEMAKKEADHDGLLTRLRTKGGGSFSGAVPEIIRGGSPDPRGREVITIMHPVYQQELKEKGSMLVSGIPGDGQPDKLVFQALLEGIDDSQEPSNFVVHVNVNGKHLSGSYRPETQISDYAYLTKIVEVPLGFDVSGKDVVKIDAWVELPEGGVSRNVIDRARLASCGWTGTLSGTRSGPLSGDLVLNLKDFADADPKILAQLGLPEVGLSMPAGTLVDTLMMTGHPPFPAFVVNDEGFASAIFSGPTDAAIGGETQSPLRFSEQTDEYFAGTASATMLDARNGGNVTVSAQFVWNADSLCDIDLIAAAAANAPQGGESP